MRCDKCLAGSSLEVLCWGSRATKKRSGIQADPLASEFFGKLNERSSQPLEDYEFEGWALSCRRAGI